MTAIETAAAERRASALVDAFLAGDFGALQAAGDPEFAAASKPEDFAGVRAALGALHGRRGLEAEARDGLILIEARVQFECGLFAFRLALRDMALSGFFIAPVDTPSPAWSAPDYVNSSRFTEQETAVGPLPATLTLPKGRRQPPVCLFVHGSGPGDRDETLGPNKPFRDLAQGLAMQGVASLRYDKRTRVFPGEFAALSAPTVKDEVLDDVAAALRLLARREDVGRIVVLGHSLGATLAPRIVEENPQVAAAVMIAAAARPLADVTLAQVEYLESLKPTGQLEHMRAELARVRAARPGDVGPPFLGVPLSWWADLNVYDPVATARRLTTPILILHGGRDYQVTDADFDHLRGGLIDRPNVHLRRLAELNHLMMAGKGPSQPAEYRQPGHVDAAVIDAVAAFALAL